MAIYLRNLLNITILLLSEQGSSNLDRTRSPLLHTKYKIIANEIVYVLPEAWKPGEIYLILAIKEADREIQKKHNQDENLRIFLVSIQCCKQRTMNEIYCNKEFSK